MILTHITFFSRDLIHIYKTENDFFCIWIIINVKLNLQYYFIDVIILLSSEILFIRIRPILSKVIPKSSKKLLRLDTFFLNCLISQSAFVSKSSFWHNSPIININICVIIQLIFFALGQMVTGPTKLISIWNSYKTVVNNQNT